MRCPNCGHLPLLTKQTMQANDKTYRYKRCCACSWNFTSVEEIPDTPPVISSAIRKGKSK